jgi:hypothetical protein
MMVQTERVFRNFAGCTRCTSRNASTSLATYYRSRLGHFASTGLFERRQSPPGPGHRAVA